MSAEAAGAPTEADAPAAPAPRRSAPALVTIAALGVLGLLWIAETVFLPAVLALLLSFLLRPPVRWLGRRGLPTALAALLVLAAIGGGAAALAVSLAQPTSEWMQRLPNSLPEIQRKLEGLRRPVEQVDAAAKRMQEAAVSRTGDGLRPVPVEVTSPGLSRVLVSTTQRFLAGASITVILLFFLLASGDGFLVRVARLFPSRAAASGEEVVLGANAHDRAQDLLLETEHQMSRYLVVFTLLNLGFGVLTGIAMAALGLPNPVLWALVGCVFNYIPYLGNLITVSLIGAVSLLSFDRALDALWPPLAFIAIRAIEGNFVMPWVVSQRFAMNTVAVFVWTVFWTWMWGVLGGFVAVPILALVKLVSERVERLRPLAAFLEP